jgi:hypothetical protein
VLGNVGNVFKEVDEAGLERILGPDDEQSRLLNQLLEQFGAMTQVIHGSTDIGTHGFTHQIALIEVPPA